MKLLSDTDEFAVELPPDRQTYRHTDSDRNADRHSDESDLFIASLQKTGIEI